MHLFFVFSRYFCCSCIHIFSAVVANILYACKKGRIFLSLNSLSLFVSFFVDMYVNDVKLVSEKIQKMVSEYKGYISDASVSSHSSLGVATNGFLNVRIPVERAAPFTNEYANVLEDCRRLLFFPPLLSIFLS